jgi:DNA-binding CsgD family transcriptional regulator
MKKLHSSFAAAERATFPRLTRREQQVLESIGKGRSSEQIAAELSISISTVGHHRMHVREKLGLKWRVISLKRAALQRGLG